LTRALLYQKKDLSWRNAMSSRNMVKQYNLFVSVSRVHAYMALLHVVTSCMRKQSVMCQKQHTIVSCVRCAPGFQGTRLFMKISTNSLLCFCLSPFFQVPSIGLSCLLPNHAPFLTRRVGWKAESQCSWLRPVGCHVGKGLVCGRCSSQLKNH
jgi:hypothetical protein